MATRVAADTTTISADTGRAATRTVVIAGIRISTTTNTSLAITGITTRARTTTTAGVSRGLAQPPSPVVRTRQRTQAVAPASPEAQDRGSIATINLSSIQTSE